MNGNECISPLPAITLNPKDMERFKSFVAKYDEADDVLYIVSEPVKPSISFDLEGEIWVRLAPNTHEVLGFQIDDFERVFLKRHRQLRTAWQSFKPACHVVRRDSKDNPMQSLVDAIMRLLEEFFSRAPRQTCLIPTTDL